MHGDRRVRRPALRRRRHSARARRPVASRGTDRRADRAPDRHQRDRPHPARPRGEPHLCDQGGGYFLQTSGMGGHIAFPAMSVYHISKWAIEGFIEVYALETEPFGIHTTLIEPGMVATDFYGSADITPSQLPAYAGTQAADFTPSKNSVPLDAIPGDPRKVAEAMIRIGDLKEPPRRRLEAGDGAFSCSWHRSRVWSRLNRAYFSARSRL
ncbi:SDR family NAD(P)-dependent oxidoreductase [Streptomyces sp. NPDC058086]|uniref:SDR family NAD(P)-dependent oxidoreductase n=1 Tax=Streptomyces sp. NPDC058086 TaxID=3346334 RepID=UPI0036E0CB72